jgi:hypothetical protein
VSQSNPVREGLNLGIRDPEGAWPAAKLHEEAKPTLDGRSRRDVLQYVPNPPSGPDRYVPVESVEPTTASREGDAEPKT